MDVCKSNMKREAWYCADALKGLYENEKERKRWPTTKSGRDGRKAN